MSMLKTQVAEVHCEANPLLGERRSHILIDRELRYKADGVVVKDSKRGRTNEHLAGLGVCHNSV